MGVVDAAVLRAAAPVEVVGETDAQRGMIKDEGAVR
jgi:hypothetical protein